MNESVVLGVVVISFLVLRFLLALVRAISAYSKGRIGRTLPNLIGYRIGLFRSGKNNSNPELHTTGHRSWMNDDSFPYSAPWWFRYPLAALIGWGGLYSFDNFTGPMMLAIVAFALMGTLVLAREAAVAAVAVALVWCIGGAITAIPTSAAIIIGAVIIAISNQK